MNYYRLGFKEHPAEEGENWASKGRYKCSGCGRMALPYANLFPTPDDGVEDVDAAVWDPMSAPLFYCAGIILVRLDVSRAMESSTLTGFVFRDAGISSAGQDDDQPSATLYRWMVVTGRCVTNDVWRRVTGHCGVCGIAFTEPADNARRALRIRQSFPEAVDVCRAREDGAGVLVSARIRAFLLDRFREIEQAVDFQPVPFDGPED